MRPFLHLRVGRREQDVDCDGTDPGNPQVDYELKSTTLRILQFRAIGVLVVASTGFRLLHNWFDSVPGLRFLSWFFFVDSEQTIPSLYSTLTLLCCAVVVAVVGWIVQPASDLWGWRALSIVFALAALDENAALHEKAIEPIRSGLAIDRGPLYYAWVIPGAFVVVLLAVAFSGFLRRLPADTQRRYLAAGVLFVMGAIGFEALAASYVSGGIEVVAPDVDPDAARAGLLYILVATIEEGLEMMGSAVFLTATVAHIENHLGRRLSLTILAIGPPSRGRGHSSSHGSVESGGNGSETVLVGGHKVH